MSDMSYDMSCRRHVQHSRIGVYLGHTPFHAGSVALVLNPSTGRVSPQFHVVFDDEFSTVEYMAARTVPANWPDLWLMKISTWQKLS
jgi:hypothetical protein